MLLARGGAGKTLAVQDRLLELKRRRPLAKVWVLLSTERQIVDFRRRLMERGDARVLFNVETFNFYSLYHHLLAGAGTPQRCLDETARYGLIRALLADLYADRPGIFGGIAQMPGFVRIIADFIYELKQNLILPQAFKQAARLPKEVELGDIYAEYQQALRDHDLVDREGEGWLALEAVEREPRLVREVDLLVVDGYDQFNPLQAELLTMLGAGVGECITTLTTVPGREATVGRRFAEALDRLERTHAAHGLPFAVVPLAASGDERPPALIHLTSWLLGAHSPPSAAGEAIQWIEAPDPPREVGAVLRRVKRLLLEGCAPDDILIALRDWSLYGGQVAVQGESYGLPLALHHGSPLAGSPAVVALLDLLRLHAGDFRRRDLFDVLRSPYFTMPGLDAGRVTLLERIGLELRVTGGRSAWLEAVNLASRPAADDEQMPPPLAPDSAAELKAALDAFFRAVTPPPTGSVAAYIGWLEVLIGQDMPDPDDEGDAAQPGGYGYSLRIPDQIRDGDDAAVIARDLAALQGVKGVLRGLLSAQTLTGSLGYERQTDWPTFFRDLKTTIDNTTVERGAARDGRVLVTTVTDARGLPHRHVFVLGLSEGLFPQPVPEDPLLLDSERERLHAAGIRLPTQTERAGDDGLFYSLIGQARETLTLSRPHSKNGEAWAESHLWRAAWALFSDHAHQRLRLGEVADDPATPYEAALACVDRLSRGLTASWVDVSYWARIRRGRAVEQRRQSNEPHDHYSGRLRDPALIAWTAEFLSEDRVWSASQLNDYGICGFRYFAARLLRLEPLEEPEDGLDSRQLGTLYHEILETTYRRLDGTISPERLDEALAVFHAVADDLLASAPGRLRFRASSLWQQEQIVLRRKLEKLIRDDFGGQGALDKHFPGALRQVYRQEARFGEDGPFALDLDGERLRLRGSIDRIDRQGERVIVVDYKSGSTRFDKREIERGRNFQMLVYLSAAQAVIAADPASDAPREVAGGLFWQIGRDALGDLTPQDADVIAAGKAHLARYLRLARSGDFAAHANQLDADKCASYCDFHQLCRQNVMHKRKL